VTEVMHVNPQGEAIPAPVMCPERHPARGYPCDFSQGHTGPCMHVRLMVVPGGRRKFPIKYAWTPKASPLSIQP
jgi:hypothetical protein